jgi:hypothetical protein
MLKYRIFLFVTVLFVTDSFRLSAQEKNPLTVNLNESGSKYLRFSSHFDFWLRYTQMNPGSITYGDEPAENVADVSIRRIRMGMHVVPTEKLYIRINVGSNNIRFHNLDRVDLKIFDAFVEYRWKEWLNMGFGKSAWGGPSRYSSPNTARLMSLDIIPSHIPLVNLTDDFLREFGIFLKGKINNLDYRLTAFNPALFRDRISDTDPQEGIADFINTGPAEVYGFKTYLKWQFFEHESNTNPFHIGTYFDEKKVMNLGAGMEFQNERTKHLENGVLQSNDVLIFAADYFLNLPFSKRRAFTFYAAYHNFDFGPNFTRNIGVNNPAVTADPSLLEFSGTGNSYVASGTGSNLYIQVGQYFGFGENSGIQPYADIQFTDYDRLNDPYVKWDVGLNWLLDDHKSKFTLNFECRPLHVETNEGIEEEKRRRMVVFQYQYIIN